jgi:valyl-tRNA synthetase
MAALQEVVTELRRFRAEHRLAPSARLEVVAVAVDGMRAALEAGVDGIARLAGVARWTFSDRARSAAAAGSAPVDGPVGKVVVTGAELFVPLSGLVDLEEERARLRREFERADAERDRARRKLDNPGFVAKAPGAVVRAEREKLVDWERVLERLAAQLEGLG